jgi:hypothetical protein
MHSAGDVLARLSVCSQIKFHHIDNCIAIHASDVQFAALVADDDVFVLTFNQFNRIDVALLTRMREDNYCALAILPAYL